MLTGLSAAEMARLLRSREVSARDLAEAHLELIVRTDAEIGAFLHVCRDEALRMADEAQKRLDAGEGGPLTGVPIALKDNIVTRNIPTTCASRLLEGWIPPYEATTVSLLRRQGMVLLGKTNLDEFAMGSSTETSAFHPTRNPWNVECTPGGSSGGSAAAVAARMTPLALGSDTGGSIRQPAALCGVVGFKPTYGRVSRYGLVAFASSLDQIGPLARTVEDAALCAQAISGHDPKDATSLPAPRIDATELGKGTLKGKRFGVPAELFGPGTHPQVEALLRGVADTIEAEGGSCEAIHLPSIRYGVTTYYIIAPSEASSNLARFDGIRYGTASKDAKTHVELVERTRARGFGREVKARILIGTFALSSGYYDAYYVRASQVRAMMTMEFEEAFKTYDFLLGPTCPTPAFRLGAYSEDSLALKSLDACVIPANLGGFPAISLPCGLVDGLPVGAQLIAPRLADERLLQTANALSATLNVTSGLPMP